MRESLIQIKIGITINVDVRATIKKTNQMCEKKYIFGMLIHVLVKKVNF